MLAVSPRYAPAAIALHWLLALLIITSFAMGQFFDAVPKDWTDGYLNAHAMIGTAILLLVIARFSIRLRNAPPALPDGTGKAIAIASHTTHWALYALMFAVPAIGLVALFARGKGIDLGLLQIASPLERSRELGRSAKGLHGLAANALIALVALHFAAAMLHQYVWRDGLLLRMMPARK